MIHESACIDPSAKIGDGVSIGAYSIIGPDVEIGDDTWIGPHVVLNGPSVIGKRNKIFQFASVGEGPQDKKFAGEPTKLVMGDDNVVRECVTIHRGTTQDTGITIIGDRNLFMAYSHVAHDCIIGNDAILVNSSTLAGHVIVKDFAIISAFCAVHQFCTVGEHSFLSHASLVSKDVLPYIMVTGGASATVCGLNVEGLKRRGFTPEQITEIRRAYKVIYRESLRAAEAVEKLAEMAENEPVIRPLYESLKASERGILR